jgi:predicted ATPase/class 3 adenylate cyclase
MTALPTGTVTFMFTDIEGSTRLLQALGSDAYADCLERHSMIVRGAIGECGGVELGTEGDSFFAVFESAVSAVRAAVRAQHGLADATWPPGVDLRIRIGLHTGEAALRGDGDGYVGLDVHRAARVAAAGNGGQVVLTRATAHLVEGACPAGVELGDLGPHELKDFDEPEAIFQLVIEGLDPIHPPLRTATQRRTNLPGQRTSFVGRAEELQRVEGLLDGARLVTLTGPGGSGKSRLALEAAARSLAVTHDEVYVVDLSAIRDPVLVLTEIASALRVREMPGIDLEVSLRTHLHSRSVLLLLDGFEEVVEAGPAVAGLLDHVPSLTLLVTSRRPLRVVGERELAVQPMTLPARSDDPASVAESDAVQLFMERAGAVRPDLVLDGSNAHTIAAIVRRVDGLPLALELAAIQLQILEPATLAERLDQQLSLLRGGPRDAPERQRTLEAAIRWSVDALDDPTRLLLGRLSVFSAGWVFEAAVAVAGDDTDLVEGLGRLLESSLVQRQRQPDGTSRIRMLASIREYAARELPPEQAPEVEQHHADWCLELVEQAETHLTGTQQVEWLDRLDAEHDNLRSALDRAERANAPLDIGTALRTSAGLWRFWQQRGHLVEGRARLERLLSLHERGVSGEARARALSALGSLDYWWADYDAMQRNYDEQLAIARALGDDRLLAAAHFNQSFVSVVAGDGAAAAQTLEEALRHATPDQVSLRARILTSLGIARIFGDDLEAAAAPIERSLELHRQGGDDLGLCDALVALAAIALLRGDESLSRQRMLEVFEVGRRSPSPPVLVTLLQAGAISAREARRHDSVAAMLGASSRLRDDHGLSFPEIVSALMGDPAESARAALGDEAFDAAFAAGRAFDTAEIVALLDAEVSSASNSA